MYFIKLSSSLILLFLATTCIKAQHAVDTLRYVDFHIHTSLKNYYRDVPDPNNLQDSIFASSENLKSELSNWNGKKHRKGFSNLKSFSPIRGLSSYPQASWNMIAEAPLSVLCTSITPIEKRFVSDTTVKILGFRTKLSTINKHAVTKLSRARQRTIWNGSSFNELMAEYKYMCLQTPNPLPGRRNVRLVKDKNDLITAMRNRENALVLTVEGAHVLLGQEHTHKEFDMDYGINSTTISEIYKNIDSLKKLPHHVFFITLSHLSWNGIVGNAKSLDMKNNFIRKSLSYYSQFKEFRNKIFKKFSSGIPNTLRKYNSPKNRDDWDCNCDDPVIDSAKGYGWEIIQKLLDTTGGTYRILIDMKHMDVQARAQYINFVNTWNARISKEEDRIPLIISHAAVSGKNFKQLELTGTCPYGDRYSEILYPKFFYDSLNFHCISSFQDSLLLKNIGWFHPFSINMYDEEIKSVYASSGIIGITLEERVLGTGKSNYNNVHYKKLYRFLRNKNYTEEDIWKLRITEPFMRNLLYILEKSGYANEPKSWNHISLGSDFDGIIDPIDVCTNIKDIPGFYLLLQRFLPDYAEFTEKRSLLLNMPVEVLLNKLFYQNGESFILKYFR